jgi:PhnB protein
MHARLVTGDAVLLAMDAPPDRYKKPSGFFVTIDINDPAEADRIFQELSPNGNVLMPIQQTFWARRFGMLVGRFGILWMINCANAA